MGQQVGCHLLGNERHLCDRPSCSRQDTASPCPLSYPQTQWRRLLWEQGDRTRKSASECWCGGAVCERETMKVSGWWAGEPKQRRREGGRERERKERVIDRGTEREGKMEKERGKDRQAKRQRPRGKEWHSETEKLEKRQEKRENHTYTVISQKRPWKAKTQRKRDPPTQDKEKQDGDRVTHIQEERQKEPGWEHKRQRKARGKDQAGASKVLWGACTEILLQKILAFELSQDEGTKKRKEPKASLTSDVGGCSGEKEVSSSLCGPCTELRPPSLPPSLVRQDNSCPPHKEGSCPDKKKGLLLSSHLQRFHFPQLWKPDTTGFGRENLWRFQTFYVTKRVFKSSIKFQGTYLMFKWQNISIPAHPLVS